MQSLLFLEQIVLSLPDWLTTNWSWSSDISCFLTLFFRREMYCKVNTEAELFWRPSRGCSLVLLSEHPKSWDGREPCSKHFLSLRQITPFCCSLQIPLVAFLKIWYPAIALLPHPLNSMLFLFPSFVFWTTATVYTFRNILLQTSSHTSVVNCEHYFNANF